LHLAIVRPASRIRWETTKKPSAMPTHCTPFRPQLPAIRPLLLLVILLLPGLAIGQQAGSSAEDELQETATDPPGQRLQWQLSEQVPLLLTLRQTTDTITTLDPRTLRMRVESTFTFGWVVDSVAESGEMSIRQTLEAIRLRVIPPDGSETILYDSASSAPLRGPSRQLAEAVSPLIGAELTFQMTARGDVVETTLPEATREVLKRLSQAPPAARRLSPEMLKESPASTLVVFPEQPVAVDSSWEQATSIAIPTGDIPLLRQYTYRGTDLSDLGNFFDSETDTSSWHRIDFTGQLESATDEGAVDVTLAPSLRGQEVSGWLLWDANLGGITRGRTTLRQVNQASFQDKTMTIRLSSEVTWELRRR
jgi:hypothetical protein